MKIRRMVTSRGANKVSIGDDTWGSLGVLGGSFIFWLGKVYMNVYHYSWPLHSQHNGILDLVLKKEHFTTENDVGFKEKKKKTGAHTHYSIKQENNHFIKNQPQVFFHLI